jgi:hypothetical protein
LLSTTTTTGCAGVFIRTGMGALRDTSSSMLRTFVSVRLEACAACAGARSKLRPRPRRRRGRPRRRRGGHFFRVLQAALGALADALATASAHGVRVHPDGSALDVPDVRTMPADHNGRFRLVEPLVNIQQRTVHPRRHRCQEDFFLCANNRGRRVSGPVQRLAHTILDRLPAAHRLPTARRLPRVLPEERFAQHGLRLTRRRRRRIAGGFRRWWLAVTLLFSTNHRFRRAVVVVGALRFVRRMVVISAAVQGLQTRFVRRHRVTELPGAQALPNGQKGGSDRVVRVPAALHQSSKRRRTVGRQDRAQPWRVRKKGERVRSEG